MTRPKVSVLVPLYNSELHIAESIGSILSQSFDDFELVVVDDGSTDRSLEVVRSFNDRRVKVISIPVNRGISATRNRALVEAQGEYIAWLDSDDIALPLRLERQVALLEGNPDVGLCYTNFAEMDPDGKVAALAASHDDRLPPEWLILWTNPIAQSTVMLCRSTLPPGEEVYDRRKDLAEDYDLWTRLARVTRFKYLDEVLVHYRNLPTSAYHARTRTALLESIEANRRLVEDIAGESAPRFHALLTSFGGVLEEKLDGAAYADVKAWYDRMASILSTELRWDDATRFRVQLDIESRLTTLMRGSKSFYFLKGGRRALLADKPLQALSIDFFWANRLARSVARKVLKRRSTGK